MLIPELPAAFAEVKRVQRLNVPAAMEKATEQAAAAGKTPMVFHRQNRAGWLVTINLADLAAVAEMVTNAETEPI